MDAQGLIERLHQYTTFIAVLHSALNYTLLMRNNTLNLSCSVMEHILYCNINKPLILYIICVCVCVRVCFQYLFVCFRSLRPPGVCIFTSSALISHIGCSLFNSTNTYWAVAMDCFMSPSCLNSCVETLTIPLSEMIFPLYSGNSRPYNAPH